MVFQRLVSKLIQMRCWLQTALMLVLGTSLFGAENVAADALNDYQVFLDRNPFNLRPPPKPAPKPPPPPVEETPVSVKITGISTLFNKKRVFLVNQPEGEPPKYLKMEEGERDSGIEVIAIDEEAGSVQLQIGKIKKTLTFKDDGFKGSGAAPRPGGRPKTLPTPTTRRPTPTRTAPSRSIPAPPVRKPSAKFNFQRTPRTSSTPRSTGSVRGGSVGVPVPSGGNGATRTIRLNSNQPVQGQQPQRIPLDGTPEEQIIKLLAQKEVQGEGRIVEYEYKGKRWKAFEASAPLPFTAKEVLGE